MKLLLNRWHILVLVGMVGIWLVATYSVSYLGPGQPDPLVAWAVRLAVAYVLGWCVVLGWQYSKRRRANA